jgi:anti-anti-sigma factor
MAFDSTYTVTDGVAHVTLSGELDASSAPKFKSVVEEVAGQKPKRLVLHLAGLSFMASAGLRVLVFAKQKMGAGVDIYVIGCQPPVQSTLTMSGFHHSVYLQDSYAG